MCGARESGTEGRQLPIHVLSFAASERPVLPGYFHQIDEEVLRTQAGIFGEYLCHTFIELALLLGLASGTQRDLHKDYAVGALNAEILRVVDKTIRVVFGNHLKPVIGGNCQGLQHGPVNAIGHGSAVFRRCALAK